MNRFSWEPRKKNRIDKANGILSRMLRSRYIFCCLLFFIWYVCTWFVGAHLLRIETKEGIYTKSTFIKELSSVGELRDAVLTDLNQPKVLIFYSSFCAYCHMVSNSLKKVAESLTPTGVKFYAFECGKGYSECSIWGIDGLPNLRLIGSENKKINLESLINYTEFSDINCTRKSEKHIVFPEKHIPKLMEVPYLKHLKSQSVSMSVINEDTFVMCSIIRAFDLANVFKPLNDSVLSSSAVSQMKAGTSNYLGRWSEESMQISPSHAIVDAITTKFYILHNWVFFGNNVVDTTQFLEKKRLNALYRFVETSWVLIPSKRTRVKLEGILLFLKKYMDNNDNSIYSKLSLDDWQRFIKTVLVEGISITQNGSDPTFYICKKSLFCGIWLLFHSWSVSLLKGVQRQGKGCPLYNGPSLTPGQVVNRIAETVKYFMVCQSCKEHFEAMINNNTCDRTSYIPPTNGDKFPVLPYEAEGLVFWLFRVHNLVTLRVATESSYEHLKQKRSSSASYVGTGVSFPPIGLCFDCYRPNQTPAEVTNQMLISINDLTDDDYDKNIFEQGPVVAFLETYYWKEGWILPKTSLDLQKSELVSADSFPNSNSIDPFDSIKSFKGSAEIQVGSVFDIFPVLYPILTFFIFSLTVFYLVETGPFLQENKLAT
ncbi:thioredoxin having signal peptide and 12 transmembrane domains [Cryptosporidium sp. chipmunk genotype I]|uniref:thioredoxin having signal peptide and 12 transmembrane domains n=1 Tax=Cryptosporidium sp. chipmunk genotype I TaxID=1280935 RepID=UPI00351A5F52|nr:thioredoxin having signal peptide and 12 transmembrane domains [Cryptosporidium sp. chipmunk genotype I]